jgi:PleD family two-component response regulator
MIFSLFLIHKLRTALENQRELAGTDPLTSVANKRAFYDLANLELNKARRYHTPISFLYTDINPFASIDEIIDAADTQLCIAKQYGKNRVRYRAIVGEKKMYCTLGTVA